MGSADLFAVLCDCHVEVAEGFCGILPNSQVTGGRCDMDNEVRRMSPGARILEICRACSLNGAEDPRDCPMAGVAECSGEELGEANAQLDEAARELCRRAQCDEDTVGCCRDQAPPAEHLSKWMCPAIEALGNPVALQQACMVLKCPGGQKDLYALSFSGG